MAKIHLQIADQAVREIALAKKRFAIGRARHNDLVLDHDGVSSTHAVIISNDHETYLEDLGSTNGTKVNGQPIMKHFLKGGDVIELAACTLQYGGAQPSTALPATAAAAAEKDRASSNYCARKTTVGILDAPITPFVTILNGARAGRELALSKSLTTIGRPGVQVAAIARTAEAFVLMHIEGEFDLLLNGQCIGEQLQGLHHGDIIDLQGTQLQVQFFRE